MDLPFFFSNELTQQSTTLLLDETASKHAVQVLRMKEGAALLLANGKGVTAKASITAADKRKASVKIDSIEFEPEATRKIAVAISLVKNTARFEWFLEKATEIGIHEIYPLLCQRTERQVFKEERLQQILISAMQQSKQAWMPLLHQPVKYNTLVAQNLASQKFIAHCEETKKQQLSHSLIEANQNQLILIGPEGDFTNEEIELAFKHDFVPVALGNTRLRTETAGMVAATLLKLG